MYSDVCKAIQEHAEGGADEDTIRLVMSLHAYADIRIEMGGDSAILHSSGQDGPPDMFGDYQIEVDVAANGWRVASNLSH